MDGLGTGCYFCPILRLMELLSYPARCIGGVKRLLEYGKLATLAHLDPSRDRNRPVFDRRFIAICCLTDSYEHSGGYRGECGNPAVGEPFYPPGHQWSDGPSVRSFSPPDFVYIRSFHRGNLDRNLRSYLWFLAAADWQINMGIGLVRDLGWG